MADADGMLLDLYKNEENLWDSAHPDYFNREKKRKSLSFIAQMLGNGCTGLWVIYSTKEAAGKMVISKLSPRTLTIEKTWLTSFPKKMVGNSFMVCGVLYATNSYQDTPTFIRYIYDTNSQQESIHEAGNLIFNNAVDFNSSKQASSIMLDYSPREQKLYSWNKGQIQIFPVYLKQQTY